MIKPRFLYKNYLRDDTITNVTDWRDYTYTDYTGSNTLDFTVSSGRTINSWAYYIAAAGSGLVDGIGTQLTLQYESGPGTFTTLDTVYNVWGEVRIRTFNSALVLSGRRIRIIADKGFAQVFRVRQFAVGEYLESEQGQYIDASNPNFTYGYKMNNIISQNGSILARNIKRAEKMGKLNIQYTTEAYYRSDWQEFAQHALKYPFFYQPNQRDYPDDVAFAAAEKVNEPKRDGVEDRMTISWGLRMLGSERDDIVV